MLGHLLFALPEGRRADRVARIDRAQAALDHAGLAGFGPRWPHSLLAERRVPTLLVTHDAADVPAGATGLQHAAP